MSRNGAGVYTLPASYLAETGDTILADQHNSPLEDLQTDANTPRPIVAGGTGASSAVSARTNLSVMSIADIQSGYVPKVATKAALSALDTASFKAAVLTETTREKLWMWKSGDFSAEEAADTDNVNYIAADGVSTSLGCWVAATGDGVTVRTIAAGGTGADNAADARTNLGLAIGTDVQAHSAVLDATTASFTTAQETKLSGIETGADVTDATNVNAAGAVMNTDTATTDMQFVGTGSDLSIDPAKLLKRGDALANVTAATKEDAEAITPDTAPDFIRTAGYSSAGDGGGALYKKVAAEPAHEGKFSITLSDGVTVVWYELAEAIIRPQMFGAVADGIASVDTAFAAISSAISAGYFNHLRIPAGSYLQNTSPVDGDYNASFDINGAPNGVTIEGDGRDVTHIVMAEGSPARPFIIRNCDGVVVRGIHFNVTNTTNASMCLALMNVNDHLIEENTFEGATQYGLVVSEDNTLQGTCNAEVIRNNIFKDIGCIGLEPFPKAVSDTQMIYGNTFYNCGGNPNGYVSSLVSLKCGQGFTNSKVFDNLIVGDASAADAAGIGVGGNVVEVYGNTIHDVQGVAIPFTLSVHSLFPLSGEQLYMHIHDNLIEYSDGAANTNPAVTINGDRTDNGPLIYERNTIINSYLGFKVDPSPGVQLKNIQIRGNTLDGIRSDFMTLGDATDGADNLIVEDNVMVNRNLSTTTARVSMTKCSNVNFRRNRMKDMGPFAVIISLPNGSHFIEDNVVDGYNVGGSGTLGAVHFSDTGAHTHTVRRNRVLTGNGNPKSIVSGTSTTPVLIVDGNSSDALIPLYSGSVTFGGKNTVMATQLGSARHFYGTAIPAVGTYAAGDIIWNTSPSAGGNIGWVCTAFGTPGTWKTFGTIAA